MNGSSLLLPVRPFRLELQKNQKKQRRAGAEGALEAASSVSSRPFEGPASLGRILPSPAKPGRFDCEAPILERFGSRKKEDSAMVSSHLLNRRSFLAVVASGAAAGACSGGNTGPAAFGDVSAGNVKDVPVGALSLVGSEPVVLGRDAAGLYAMTVTCTHQGCDVEPAGSGTSARLDCPCHGSQFDRNGGVVHGPASAPLAHFAVDVDASGNITIHGGQQVAASVRTAGA
jgi:cytochrome b6-f complex iron-sulfur subunit